MSRRNIDPSDQLLIFGMKNIFLENALDTLETQGIEIGHAATRRDQEKTVDTELFEHDILVQARRLADFYVLYFALENSVRRLLTPSPLREAWVRLVGEVSTKRRQGRSYEDTEGRTRLRYVHSVG